MNQDKVSLNEVTTAQLIGLISLAYAFSFLVRMIWVWQFQDNLNFYWNNELMINTNDGYFFASGVQKTLEGLHASNPRVFGWFDYGVIFFTTLLVKFTPLSLETAILYMPAIISSLVVIPVILIARVYKNTLWGFFAALLGSITWSYYNRTMTGYYDTDMFSAMAPMFILYFLMKSTIDLQFRTALYGAMTIAIYPFLYDSGLSIVYAIGIMYALYMVLYHFKDKTTYISLIVVFVSLIPFPISSPLSYIVKIVTLLLLYFLLNNVRIEQKKLMIISVLFFILFLVFGNVFSLILGKVSNYIATGTKAEGLHFYSVAQTVREAGKIPFETFANRTSGSVLGVIIALLGYVALVMRHRAFILALPLIGIGIFSLWGGLRFTVYAVPVAGLSAIYLFFLLGEMFIKQRFVKYIFILIATIGMITPNIIHIIGYKVPTVLKKAEVEDLNKLKEISHPKDYTLTWWDYGYPIWFYSDTSTLIDGGKHNNDNFIISTIMQSTSPYQVANLSRVAVERYANSTHTVVADKLFKDDRLSPNEILDNLEDKAYKLPKKTRDIYLYMPYRMMNIFPTVAVFGNLDLTTGKKKRNMIFYPSYIKSSNGGILTLGNGIIVNAQQGRISIGRNKVDIKNFVVTQNRGEKIAVQSQLYHYDGGYSVVFMKSYNRFIVMDNETFNSAYVQMFILGKYDKNLFELVVSSAYSKIYKLKK